MLHQIHHGHFRVIQHSHAGVDDLRQVVRGNVGSHTNGNTGRTVYQQVGEPAGQNTGLFPGFVKVGIPVHRLLVNIPQHLIGELGKPGFCVTVSSRRVAVHGTEVAVTVHQHVTHREILCQTNHGIVNRCVAVGVILTQHITDTGCGLFKRLVGGQTAFIHCIENTAVDRL